MTFVVISPTVNIIQHVYSPNGGTLSTQNSTMIYVPSVSGVYWHCAQNLENGCATCYGPGLIYGPVSLATTGLSEDSHGRSVSIFPNPGKGNFTLNNNFNAERIEIYNAVGTLIKSQTKIGGLVNFNIEDHPNGIYIVKALGSDGKMYYSRVVKE